MVIPINNSLTLATTSGGYYGPTAYRPGSIPDQPAQQQDFNHSALRRSASFRLPWGEAQDVMPANLFSRWPPKALRRIETRRDLLAEAGDQGQLDQECIRHAPLAFRSRMVHVFEVYGKGLFWIGLVLGLVTYLMHAYLTRSTLLAALLEIWPYLLLVTGVPALMWLSSRLVFTLFPRWCVKAGRGPLWEINRRTGMVRVWRYARKISLLGLREATIIEAPFYEFDGWVVGGATQYGPRFDFVLCHRYSKLEVHLGDILLGWHHTSRPCYAFWDFLQNYMDVTRPLPEFPVLEPHRHKDPVTAEHDRKTRRPARYWRDMSDQTFTKHEDEMNRKAILINTERRPNLMAKRVRYAHMTPEDMRAYGRGRREARQSRSAASRTEA